MNLFRLCKPVQAAAFTCFVALVLLAGSSCRADEPPLKLLIFYSPSCHKCLKINHETMPPIETRFKGVIVFEYLDISDVAVFKRLIGLQQKNAPGLAIKVPLFYLNGRFLNGENITGDTVLKFINEARVLNYRDAAVGSAEPGAESHIREFRALAVAGAGLVDGINPCAFTVILFFLSFLALQGYRRRQVVMVGAGFTLAVFLTYILIGLGIFNFFYRLESFYLLARAFNLVIGMLSIVFGILALYDIYLLCSAKDTQRFVLQLPKVIKDRIHFVIGRYYRKDKDEDVSSRGAGRLCLVSFITGFLVCLLETVCTGQMYIPTITFIIKGTAHRLEGLIYLVLYNLMFILPLLLILVLVVAGVSSAAVGNFFRKHMLTVKGLMAILFFALGIYLIVWRQG